MSDEVNRARKLLEDTGFETELQWKTDDSELAIQRMKALEKKLRDGAMTMQRIIENLRDFEQEGYERRFNESEVVPL